MSGKIIDVQIESFTLRSLGAQLSYTFQEGDTPEAVDILQLEVIMDDGTMVPLQLSSGSVFNHRDPETAVGWAEFRSNSPIVLTQADYIRFPNGEILPCEASAAE